jgi:hypothetical protein
VANLVLCGIALVWFPDNDPLWIETCSNIQCDIIIYISKEQLCILLVECCELVIGSARNEQYRDRMKFTPDAKTFVSLEFFHRVTVDG